MDILQLRKRIMESTALSQSEKAYWLENAIKLNDSQQQELVRILMIPSPMPFEAEIKQIFDVLNSAAAAALQQGGMA